MPGPWLIDATAAFGATCKAKLAGPGEPEAAIRAPIEELLNAAGQQLSLAVVPHDEVHDNDRGVRPDYAISVNGVQGGLNDKHLKKLSGYIKEDIAADIGKR